MVEEEAEEEVVHEDNDWGISLVSEDAGEVIAVIVSDWALFFGRTELKQRLPPPRPGPAPKKASEITIRIHSLEKLQF